MARAKDEIQFEAIIPALKSAMNVDGDGGGQVKLEISEQYMEQFKVLMDMRGQVLTVKVKVS